MTLERYNAFLHRLQNLDTNIDNDELDILELFAQTNYLTIAKITCIIKSTKLERAYKNVHRTIQKLKSLKLIQETPVKERRHNEKFFKLRDEGIYLLFLKRLQGILVNQLLVKKGETPVSYVYNFLNHYGDNLLFEFFLYPYLEKRTISVDNKFKFNLVIELFNYLNECCKRLDLALRVQIPFMITKFSWNNIPGQDEPGLLASLKEIFHLQDTEMSNIQIDKPVHENIIKIIGPKWSVVIELNIGGRKALATLASLDSPRKYEYIVAKAGSEIFVGTIQPPEDPIKRTVNYSSSLIKRRIYELVSDIGSDSSQDEKNNIILAQDDKFMALLEDIHNNTHNKFEMGYKRLMELRKGL